MDLPPLPDEFFSATGEDLATVAWEYLDPIFFGKHHLDAEEEVLEALPEPLRDYLILLLLDLEVMQGGLRTYFMNSWGRHAQLAVDALRRLGGEGLAECLQKALAIYSKHEAAWAKRTRELDAQGEYAIVRPFQNLEGIDELHPAAMRFEEEWFDGSVWWGDLARKSLQRFRDEMAKTRTSADEEAAKAYWEAARARESEAKAHEEPPVRKELSPEAKALFALLEQKQAEARRSR